jgi:cyclophilin family peptidyl-prolyl cis-trans isomerase
MKTLIGTHAHTAGGLAAVSLLLAATVLLSDAVAARHGAFGHLNSGEPGSAAARLGDCRKVGRIKPRVEHLDPPPQTVSRRDHLTAIVKTNCGRFRIRLDTRRFPVIVNSFVYLARSGFYNGLHFDRVVPHFVVEGGDPRGNGTSGPGYRVIEPPPLDFRYRVGTVAMGKARDEARGQAGSNFFIVLGGGGYIAPDYAVLGRIRAGMDTVRRIGSLGSASEKPRQVVRIDWIRIHRR